LHTPIVGSNLADDAHGDPWNRRCLVTALNEALLLVCR
jgi:hypothetical protein